MENALPAIIAFKCYPQGFRGFFLQVAIHRCADRQTAAKKLILAEIFRQLATDLIGEVIAVRQLTFEAFKIAALDRQKRSLFGALIFGIINIAVLVHLAQNEIAPIQRALFLSHRMITRGRFGQHGQIGGFFGV